MIPKDLIALRDLQRQLPGNKALSTLHRWRERGCIGSDGRRHRLKMTKIGGAFFVSTSEFQCWLQTIAGGSESDEPIHSSTPSTNTEEVDRILDNFNV